VFRDLLAKGPRTESQRSQPSQSRQRLSACRVSRQQFAKVNVVTHHKKSNRSLRCVLRVYVGGGEGRENGQAQPEEQAESIGVTHSERERMKDAFVCWIAPGVLLLTSPPRYDNRKGPQFVDVTRHKKVVRVLHEWANFGPATAVQIPVLPFTGWSDKCNAAAVRTMNDRHDLEFDPVSLRPQSSGLRPK
jgi:hypothetical protein